MTKKQYLIDIVMISAQKMRDSEPELLPE